VFFMDAYLISVSYGNAPHGRVSHGHAPKVDLFSRFFIGTTDVDRSSIVGDKSRNRGKGDPISTVRGQFWLGDRALS
jgi:hypothetical protein